MQIKIDQALYGYKNGHQLLKASCPISQENKQVLLLHSDLTGSNVDNNFKIYYTGFPLSASNQYALCKTWYADEMKRPGCAWTHILLLAFADLGKIPNLLSISKFFQRPKEDEFESYGHEIVQNFNELDFQKTGIEESVSSGQILAKLYMDVEKAVIVPATTSTGFEHLVFQIWSNQWPRLRRNFTFCTGALNFQLLNGRPFDLQVCPSNMVDVIARQYHSSSIVDYNEKQATDFFAELYTGDNNQLRKFLWTYGADISGERRNYIPLIYLFNLLNNARPDIHQISRVLLGYFSSAKEAGLLKKAVFGAKNPFRINQMDVIRHLILFDGLEEFGIQINDLDQRLLQLYADNEISIEELLHLWSQPGKKTAISSIWEKFDFPEEKLLELLEKEADLINVVDSRLPTLAENRNTWATSTILQRDVYNKLLHSDYAVNWERVAIAMLSVNSPIVTDLIYHKGDVVLVACLNHINGQGEASEQVFYAALNSNRNAVLSWVKLNMDLLTDYVLVCVFTSFQLYDFKDLNLTVSEYLGLYTRIKSKASEDLIIYASSILLSIGFNNWIPQSFFLVRETFHFVYQCATQNRISKSTWNLIPKDYFAEDKANESEFFFPFSLWGFLPPKRRNDVPDWDYCELLIRIVAYKFISYSWPTQAFIDTLRDSKTAHRVLEYLMSFKKGKAFLSQLQHEFVNKKLKLEQYHIDVFNRFF